MFLSQSKRNEEKEIMKKCVDGKQQVERTPGGLERKEDWVETLSMPTTAWVNSHAYSMGLLCLRILYAFSNFNNFKKLIIIHILEMRTLTFREFSYQSKVTTLPPPPHQWEVDPGVKPRFIWFHRLWNLLYYLSAYPSQNFSGMVLDWRF